MKVAAIDVGTNSVRLILAKIENENYYPLMKQSVITRLGKGISSSFQLDKSSAKGTISEVKRFLELAKKEKAELVILAATQALREASDSEWFLNQLKAETGYDCFVISAREEGKLMFKAVSQAFKLPTGAVVFDIGGGSTEFVERVCDGFYPDVRVVSLPLGSVRLSESFLFSDPPAEREIEKLRKRVRKELVKLKDFSRGILYGVAGTVTTLVAVANELEPYDPEFVHGYYLKKEEVEKVAFFLASLPLKKRKEVKGLEPKRADIIVGGAFLTLEIIDFFEAQGLVVSESDLLDGLALSWKKYGQPLI